MPQMYLDHSKPSGSDTKPAAQSQQDHGQWHVLLVAAWAAQDGSTVVSSSAAPKLRGSHEDQEEPVISGAVFWLRNVKAEFAVSQLSCTGGSEPLITPCSQYYNCRQSSIHKVQMSDWIYQTALHKGLGICSFILKLCSVSSLYFSPHGTLLPSYLCKLLLVLFPTYNSAVMTKVGQLPAKKLFLLK